MNPQLTIRKQVSLTGIGLHSGEPVKMTLSPAAADTGMLFRAADGTLIPANAEHVVDTRLGDDRRRLRRQGADHRAPDGRAAAASASTT